MGALGPEEGVLLTRCGALPEDSTRRGTLGLDELSLNSRLWLSHVFKQMRDICDVPGAHGQGVHSGIGHTPSLSLGFYNQDCNHRRQSLWWLLRAKVNSPVKKWPGLGQVFIHVKNLSCLLFEAETVSYPGHLCQEAASGRKQTLSSGDSCGVRGTLRR